MALITWSGEFDILLTLRRYVTWEIALYTTDVSISQASVLTDFTLANFNNSAPIKLNNWYLPTIVNGVGIMVHPPAVWTLNEGTCPVCYGYVVYDYSNGQLIWASKFISPLTIPGVSRTLTIAVSFSDQDSTDCCPCKPSISLTSDTILKKASIVSATTDTYLQLIPSVSFTTDSYLASGSPPPSPAPFILQGDWNSTTSSGFDTALSPTTAGNCVAIFIATRTGNVLTSTNGMTFGYSASQGSGGDGASMWCFYIPNCDAGINHCSFTSSINTYMSWVVVEIQGANLTSPIDVMASNGGNSTIVDSGTTTITSSSDELIICGIACIGAPTFTGWTNGFAEYENVDTFNTLEVATLTTSVVGTQNTSATISGSPVTWCGIIVAFTP